jgi:hypothetical protein
MQIARSERNLPRGDRDSIIEDLTAIVIFQVNRGDILQFDSAIKDSRGTIAALNAAFTYRDLGINKSKEKLKNEPATNVG